MLRTESYYDCIFNYRQEQLFENIYYRSIIFDSQTNYEISCKHALFRSVNFLVWKDYLSNWYLSAVKLDIRLNWLFLFTAVLCIGQLVRTLTGVFFLIGWIFHEYRKYPERNPGSFYFTVTIWWWSYPHSEYGLCIKWSRYKSSLSLATMGAGSGGQPIVSDFPYWRILFKNFTNSGKKS